MGGTTETGGRRLWSFVALSGLVWLVSGCGVVSSGEPDVTAEPQDVVAAAGWTRVATTNTYLVVANVLPGERMFTAAEVASEHPTEGELIIDGPGNALGADVRHVEAHIYDRATGLPLTKLRPRIVLLDRTTGQRTEVTPTLMQDVVIGAPDVHYGNNVVAPGGSDLSLTVTIGTEEVTLDGHLD